MTKAPPSIAATSTLAMVRTAEARGIQTADLLEEAGLTRESLEDPDARIPAPTVLAIWNALRERTARPGPPARRARHPPVRRLPRYRLSRGRFRHRRRRRSSFCALLRADRRRGHPQHRPGQRRAFPLPGDGGRRPGPAGVRGLRLRGAGQPHPHADPARPAGAPGRASPARAAGNRAVQRDSSARPSTSAPRPTGCASAPRSGTRRWRARTRRSLGSWRSTPGSSLERIPHAASGFRADVQKAIASVLPEGGSAADVARALHVSVRTLQRKLVATGTTFREVSETVRSQLAEEYLTDPRVSIAEVAFLLGFSDQSSFNRAFRRRTGQSPGRWRRGRA